MKTSEAMLDDELLMTFSLQLKMMVNIPVLLSTLIACVANKLNPARPDVDENTMPVDACANLSCQRSKNT